MFLIPDNSTVSTIDLVSIVGTNRALTTNETALLHAEVTNDASYAGLDKPATLKKLCSAYTVSNPVPVTLVKADFQGDHLRGMLASKIFTIADPTLRAKWQQMGVGFTPYITEVVHYSQPLYSGILDTIASQAIADGVFTQSDWDAFAKQTDPAYVSQIPHIAPADRVLGVAKVILTLEDITAIRV